MTFQMIGPEKKLIKLEICLYCFGELVQCVDKVVYFWWFVLENLRVLHHQGVSLSEESHEPQAQEVSEGNKNDRIEFVIFYYMIYNILLIMFAKQK
jgi:hypothetical protein